MAPPGAGTARPRGRGGYWLYLVPSLVLFLAIIVVPLLMNVATSFTRWSGVGAPTWIGLDNYTKLVNDPIFWKSLTNTLYITVVGVPLAVVVALGIALLLNRRGIRGIGIFRTIFYLPVVVPTVASAVLWIWLLNPQYGLVNQVLGAVGIDGPKWFFDPDWTKPGIVLMTVWGVGDVVIIYLGALQGVPRDLYEAADVDGAGRWAKVRNVTIPLISPAILFNLITGAIGIFQYFTQAYVISEGTTSRGSGAVGGIQNSLLFYGLNLYNNAFRYFRLGYASALAWILLLIILAFTVLMLWASRRRVYYAGER